jgi:hypothetical protein
MTTSPDRLSDQTMVVPFAVARRGVEKVDAELKRAMDRGNLFAIVAFPIGPGHAHAPEPHRRDDEIGVAEA